MNLTAKCHALTQREKILVALLGITVLITACVYVYPLIFAGNTTGTEASVPPQEQVKPVVIAEIPMKSLPAANLKNPFIVPMGYQVAKDSQPSGNKPGGSGGPTGPTGPTGAILPVAKTVLKVPVLNGIVTSGAVRMAIIELAGDSDTLGVGGTIGGYTVMAITGSQVTVKGPEGNRVLNLGGDLH